MLFIANYLMRGFKQAATLTVVFAVLTLFLSPFGILWGASISLVTLRLGIANGLKLFLLSAIVVSLLSMLIAGSISIATFYILIYALPLWIMAVILRKTQALEKVLIASMLLSLSLVVVFHLLVGDTQLWWGKVLSEMFSSSVYANMGLPADKLQLIVQQVTPFMTPSVAMLFTGLWFGVLLLSRSWQSKLYFPGKFRQNFFCIRLPKAVSYVTIFLFVLEIINHNNFLTDIVAVFILGLMFQGLAIVHKIIDDKKYSKSWLVTIYFLLSLIPQMILILAVVALLDTWLDLRKLNGIKEV